MLCMGILYKSRKTLRNSTDHGGYFDPRTAEVAADDRASGILLFACRDNVHLHHLSLIGRLPEADQQTGLLRVLGEHPLQRCNSYVGIAHRSRS